MTIEKIASLAIKNGFVVSDTKGFTTPGEYIGVKIALFVATGESMSDGYDYAGFDDSGKLVAVGKESGGPGAFGYGGWVWVDGRIGAGIPKTRLSVLWER